MLDFAFLSAQMEQMLDDETARPPNLDGVFALSKTLCQRSAQDSFNGTLAQAIQSERVPQNWHPALLLNESDAPHAVFRAPDAPPNHRVVASDGSQIYADAHQISDCYLLHISAIDLHYGAQSSAQMSATPRFFWNGMQDSWHEEAGKNGSVVVKELIDARRHVAELDELARLLEAQNAERQNHVAQNREASDPASDIATLGMSDGIFDLRVSSQQSWRDWAQSENERALDRLRSCGQPVCGYIAASRATDVVTSLRVLASEWKIGDEISGEMARLSDARLFNELLQNGARSAVFQSRRNLLKSSTRSAPNPQNSSRHQTCFFYLKIEERNVARLEFPIWVAQKTEWLEQIHALVLAQIERGDGYPIALMEAHEHAIVRGIDREIFYSLLEELMLRKGIKTQVSSKNRSKMRPLV